MSSGGSFSADGIVDERVCPDCDQRHDPRDVDRCEVNQLRAAAAGEQRVPEDDDYPEQEE